MLWEWISDLMDATTSTIGCMLSFFEFILRKNSTCDVYWSPLLLWNCCCSLKLHSFNYLIRLNAILWSSYGYSNGLLSICMLYIPDWNWDGLVSSEQNTYGWLVSHGLFPLIFIYDCDYVQISVRESSRTCTVFLLNKKVRSLCNILFQKTVFSLQIIFDFFYAY
jgi:hypothetical protein